MFTRTGVRHRISVVAGFLLLIPAIQCAPARSASTVAENGGAGERRSHPLFEISDSAVLDGATFLNALSDNPRFNAGWLAWEPRQEWLNKVRADRSLTEAFPRWQGRGIQLAYLLSTRNDSSIDELISEISDHPVAVLASIEANIDEPAYRPVFADMKEHLSDILAWFQFLKRQGFSEMRTRVFFSDLEDRKDRLESLLTLFDSAKMKQMYEAFSGISVERYRVRLNVFSRPLSFQLSGPAIAWSGEVAGPGNSCWLLFHEFLHKFNPARDVLAWQAHLAEADSFYKKAWDRIYGEFQEGKEEEFVDAAARFMTVRLGLETNKRILRHLKTFYFSAVTNEMGAPLDTIIFSFLQSDYVDSRSWSYASFLAGLSSSNRIEPGRVESLYRASLASVSGSSGLAFDARPEGFRITKVLDGGAGAGAGCAVGDIWSKANDQSLQGMDLEDFLDLITGPAGMRISANFARSSAEMSVSYLLK